MGYWGVMTLANELLYVVLPLKLIVDAIRFPDRTVILGVVAAAWAACVIGLRTARPEAFTPTAPRLLMPSNTDDLGSSRRSRRTGFPTASW